MATTPFPFENSYAQLPANFYARVEPAGTADAEPHLIKLNDALADQLGLDATALRTTEGVEMLAGRRVPEGAEPIALAYAGHQFGHFQPQLGDGRALLLGEVVGRDGRRRDIQLKGSGRTPFSRSGDGRAALGPVLREYLVSEAMAALGVPTTRALAAVTTGETVHREVPLPGAVLTRVAASHIRIGTFQYFAARGDIASIRQLADHAIARHDPAAAQAENPYAAFLTGVVARQAALVARWMQIGFIHGVMNTDNMSVSGETIDYGPCAFMDAYDPATVFSSIDRNGRYAYGNQPRIAQWNLARLAECLIPLLADDKDTAIATANAVLTGFVNAFNRAHLDGFRRKLGLEGEQEGDGALVDGLLTGMQEGRADFTLTFRLLCDAAADPAADAAVRVLFTNPEVFDAWAVRWRARLGGTNPAAAMRRVNPAVIPRNHQVEAVIAAAITQQDFAPFERLLAVLASPYDDLPPADAAFALPPEESERVYQTFCGT